MSANASNVPERSYPSAPASYGAFETGSYTVPW